MTSTSTTMSTTIDVRTRSHRRSTTAPLRFVLVPCLALLVATAPGCGGRCSNEKEDEVARLDLRSVPAREGLEALRGYLPEQFRLESGEIARQPSFSLASDGIFSVTQSIEREAPFVGLGVTTLTVPVAREKGLEVPSGVLVNRVESPAREVGIEAGAILLSVAGRDVVTPEQLEAILAGLGASNAVDVVVFQHGKTVNASIQPQKATYIVRSHTWDVGFDTVDDFEHTGMRYILLPDAVRPAVLGAETGSRGGLVVAEVLAGGPGFWSGVRVKDLLVAIDDAPVDTAARCRELLAERAGGGWSTFTVVRAGETLQIPVKVSSNARSEGGFEVPFLIEYNHKPARTRFEMILGLLANYSNCRSYARAESPRVETSWGMIADLIRCESRPDRTKVWLLWIIPIWYGS